MSKSYKLAGADVVFEKFNNDVVVLNLRSGRYFGLNTLASSLWLALMAGATSTQIVKLGVDEVWVNAFILQLVDHGLVISVDTDVSTELDESIIAALRLNAVAPKVEVYDDLSDLIIADPIHDVDDQTGWPHLPPGKNV
jgi:hypothetical protein